MKTPLLRKWIFPTVKGNFNLRSITLQSPSGILKGLSTDALPTLRLCGIFFKHSIKPGMARNGLHGHPAFLFLTR
jgi:hypothetical protein